MIDSFPGYTYENGDNMFRGVNLGKGGYIYSEPGMYSNVVLLDAQSMHPTSIITMRAFGEYTSRYEDIYKARLFIKHRDYDSAKQLLGGVLAPYLVNENQAAALSKALKLCLNGTYGLTAANFDNPFRDTRNKNNIVALRGALFMKTLQDEVQAKGFVVCHIKTDSIKIPNATPEIIEFCADFAQQYGYSFEHEATYDKMCLINKSVYIAKDRATGEWTATGAQFAVPYVLKTLFTKENIEFEDLCETKEVKTALYLDMNEDLPEGEHNLIFIGKTGRFCPMKAGSGGGELLRESTDKEGNLKYDAPSGTIGYRWLEAELVKELGKENDVDRSYFKGLVDEAVTAISQYGDFEWFVSDDTSPMPTNNIDTPPWLMECGKESCVACSHFHNTHNHMVCSAGYNISELAVFNSLGLDDDGDLFNKR